VSGRKRTHAWRLAAVVAVVAGLATSRLALEAEPGAKVVTIASQRFRYTPDRIVLKKGEPVILELTSSDVLMGFNLAAFHLRADIIPGKITRIRFTPDETGVFEFFCDVFCGGGHELMAGSIEVVD
jgi:cytochrome c oxidase subunit 2